MIKIYGLKLRDTPLLATPIAGRGEELKAIYGATFDKQNGYCFFPAFRPFLKNVLNDLKIKFPDAAYQENANQIIAEANELEDKFSKEILDKPIDFIVSPYAHQQKSFMHALYNPRSALFLECGLGKSAIIVWLLRYLKEPALILCPPALIRNWELEIAKYSLPGEFKIEKLNDKHKTKQVKNEKYIINIKQQKLDKGINSDILLVGYKTATLYEEDIFKSFDYKIIVCDESQKIKNIRSNQAKTALNLASKAYRRHILSGTAVTNSPEDLYPQLKFLCPALVEDNFWAYCHKFQDYSKYHKHIVVGYKNLHVLNQRVNSIAMRYKKEECLDLPERLTIPRKFQLSDEQRKIYQELLNDDTLYLDEGEISKQYKLTIFGKLAQVSGGFLYVPQTDEHICDNCMHMLHCVETKVKPYTKLCAKIQKAPPAKTKVFKDNPKLDLFLELTEEITVEPTNKILAWARHVWELEAMSKALTEAGIKHHVLPDNSEEVIPFVESFNKDIESKVLLSQISRGVGFTATSANYVIYYSLSFNLEDYLQSRDRLYRIGQTRKVIEYILVAEDTIDEHIVKALDLKQDIQETLISKVECFRCSKNISCLMDGTQPWDPKCFLFDKKRKKTLALS